MDGALDNRAAQIDVLQAHRFLRALSATDTPVVVFQCIDDAKQNRPGLTEHRAGTLTQLTGYLRAQNQRGAAIFFQVNAGGRGDEGVHSPRALLIDDDLKAATRPDLSALPPSAIVRSGGTLNGQPKMHYYWFLVDGEPLDAWLPAMQHLARAHHTDTGILKLSLVMRLPGFLHRKGEPQRTELLQCDPARRFTINEVVAAFPATNGVAHKTNGTNGAAARHALVDQALAGDLPPPEKGADGRDPDDAPHTDASKATFQRVCDWLKRIGEPFIVKEAKPRFIYLTRGCPRNREHKDAVIITGTRGGIVFKCFHDSCGSVNKNGWNDVKNILGSWAELRRGDHVELAIRLRNELRAEYKSEIITESGHRLAVAYRYDEKTGAWVAIHDEALECRIMNYAGIPYGEQARAKKLNDADISGVLRRMKVYCAQPGFFEQAPAGALFTNGFLVIRGARLTLLPHDAENRARASFPYAYDPNAQAPRWSQFLREVFVKDPDAEEKILFLQEFFGACILGVATRYQKSVFMTGEGSNGKSVALKVLSALFPPSFISAVRPHEMDDQYSRALLHNKRINIVTELPDRELLSVSGFNAMIDGSLINGRPIREAPITFMPTAAHVFACNRLPSAKDFSRGFWRRTAVVSFNREFSEAEQDKYLPDRIIDTELGGVCNWCLIGGARLLAQHSYSALPSSDEARSRWQEQNNPVAMWLKEETEPTPLMEAGASTTEELFQAFKLWADENKYLCLSKVQFSLRLEALRVEHTRRKVEGKARMVWAVRLLHNYTVV